ncbi:multicopper oxidase domain-containing protein [Desulfoscipio gibsoniae]|uniref:Putative multicopper oxidase n=1 Tax=Desulfoscipio gibsoniae DSM 7213 TaxID=767817 RepID=R4KIC3_9FIRM|nr:multicopper oxidase domain-containing protein [Desulfoscipio gibsoniae]AGL00280.1 putative multicopper oxidase [Desulfoscipio gibsoniae DSM 7213]
MPEINLWAKDGYLSTPDGNSIYFWGFAKSAAGPAQLPGPNIIARQGETITVNLHNMLAEPVSIAFPGQQVTVEGQPVQPQYKNNRLLSFVNYAEPGGTVAYTFTPSHPGTYLYESGTNPYQQVPMGLYGGMVVRPADYNPDVPEYKTAYGAGTDTGFDREYLLITGEIDPDLHQAVENGKPYRVSKYVPRYWTLNGRCAPDTMLMDHVDYLPHQPYGAMIMGLPGEKILLRYIGAGIDNHPLHPHGAHTRVVAVDGRLLRNGNADLSYKRFTVLVGVGQTYDQIYQWDGLGYTPGNPIPTVLPNLRNMGVGDAGWTMWSGSPYLGVKGDIPVGVVSYNEMGEYYFMLHSHEELQITNWGEFPGGMMTMVAIYPSLAPDIGVIG